MHTVCDVFLPVQLFVESNLTIQTQTLVVDVTAREAWISGSEDVSRQQGGASSAECSAPSESLPCSNRLPGINTASIGDSSTVCVHGEDFLLCSRVGYRQTRYWEATMSK